MSFMLYLTQNSCFTLRHKLYASVTMKHFSTSSFTMKHKLYALFMIKPGQFYPEAQALCPYLPQNSSALPLNTSFIPYLP